MPAWFVLLSQISVLAFALLGGVFLAFSDFLMRALDRTRGTGGIDAMQTINREVFRYVFMILFLGMAPVSLVLAGYGAAVLSGPGAASIALAGLLYLVAAFGITVAFNVPLNEALARMELASSDTQRFWKTTYLPRWTFWNSVRALACAVAAALALGGVTAMAHAGAV